jgi:formiminotetrahydrofolate cyclodeaminase
MSGYVGQTLVCVCLRLHYVRVGIIVKLDELSIRDFIDELSSSKATPGGGSVAALCGSLGAALSAMVAALTRGKEKFTDRWNVMEEMKQSADLLTKRFLGLVQQDTDAYQEVVAALKLPREMEEQKDSRREAMQSSLKRAATVPMETLRTSKRLMEIAHQAVEQGDPVAITDAGAAVCLAYTAGTIAAYNVRINLSKIEDEGFRLEYSREAEEILARLKARFTEMEAYIGAQLR